HQVIVHDHRGTGQSSRSLIRYCVDQMCDDLVRLMDHLEISQAHLVGHSTGGAIGQTLAVKRPERLRSLVIYASWTKADPFFRRVFEARRALLTGSGAAAYARSTAIFLYQTGGSMTILDCSKNERTLPFRDFRLRRLQQVGS